MHQCNFCGLMLTNTEELDRHVVSHIKSQQFDGEHRGDICMRSDSVTVKTEVLDKNYLEKAAFCDVQEGIRTEDASIKVESAREVYELLHAADQETSGSGLYEQVHTDNCSTPGAVGVSDAACDQVSNAYMEPVATSAEHKRYKCKCSSVPLKGSRSPPLFWALFMYLF